MEYQGIRKVHEGKFITRYDVDYVTAEGLRHRGRQSKDL